MVKPVCHSSKPRNGEVSKLGGVHGKCFQSGTVTCDSRKHCSRWSDVKWPSYTGLHCSNCKCQSWHDPTFTKCLQDGLPRQPTPKLKWKRQGIDACEQLLRNVDQRGNAFSVRIGRDQTWVHIYHWEMNRTSTERLIHPKQRSFKCSHQQGRLDWPPFGMDKASSRSTCVTGRSYH